MKKIFALGFFDGVHLGHQALLAECCRMAQELDAAACAITFQQHPQSLFVKNPPKLINTEQDRRQLLRDHGIGSVVSFPVTKEVMSMSWQAFLEELEELGAVGFVCGRDFRFGNGGEGSAEKLQQYCRERNLPCSIVEDQLCDGVRVSSTHIRKLLEEGNLEQANRFLGHPHMLTGTVVQGQQLGRTIGIPTANLLYPECLTPLHRGAYACMAEVDGKRYPAVTNVGVRPTVEGVGVNAESWLLDFSGDLYGKTLRLSFYAFLRPEKKFPDLASLQEEIRKNGEETKEIFEKK